MFFVVQVVLVLTLEATLKEQQYLPVGAIEETEKNSQNLQGIASAGVL